LLMVNKVTSFGSMSSKSRAPIQSTNPSWVGMSYDRVNEFSSSETPDILRGKEDMAPDYLFNTYWHSYWKNLLLSSSYGNSIHNDKKFEEFYLPTIAEYSEYDFKNWQALEFLEDAFWEANYSSLAHEDYIKSLLTMTQNRDYFNKIESIFNANIRVNPINFNKSTTTDSLSGNLDRLYNDTVDTKLNKIKFKYLHKLTYSDYLNMNTPLHTEEFFL
jgi:hypothetical protein